jgi:hypothetical protein
MPNAAIATHLVISTRMVENHLHHIFAKLGITRRTDQLESIGDQHRRRARPFLLADPPHHDFPPCMV